MALIRDEGQGTPDQSSIKSTTDTNEEDMAPENSLSEKDMEQSPQKKRSRPGYSSTVFAVELRASLLHHV